jgi:ornithine carbamoyltransferase
MVAVEALKRRLEQLDSEALEALRGRSLHDPLAWSREELETLLQLAESLEALDRRHLRANLLPAQLAAAIVWGAEPTARWAWRGAAARLGMAPVILSPSEISPGLAEVGALAGMNAHALGICPPRGDEARETLEDLAAGVGDYLRTSMEGRALPVISLGPATLALGDVLALREVLGTNLEGKRAAIVLGCGWGGDAARVSAAKDLAAVLVRFGLHVSVVSPEGAGPCAHVEHAASLDALAGVHALAWLGSGSAGWILDAELMSRTADALLLQDVGQAPEGIAPEVLEGTRGAIARQANKRTYVVMAALAATKVGGLWDRLQELLD